MMGNWWQHKVDAEIRRRDIYRDMERERLARQLPGPSSLAAEHLTVELLVAATGISAGALMLMGLL